MFSNPPVSSSKDCNFWFKGTLAQTICLILFVPGEKIQLTPEVASFPGVCAYMYTFTYLSLAVDLTPFSTEMWALCCCSGPWAGPESCGDRTKIARPQPGVDSYFHTLPRESFCRESKIAHKGSPHQENDRVPLGRSPVLQCPAQRGHQIGSQQTSPPHSACPPQWQPENLYICSSVPPYVKRWGSSGMLPGEADGNALDPQAGISAVLLINGKNSGEDSSPRSLCWGIRPPERPSLLLPWFPLALSFFPFKMKLYLCTFS